MPLAIMISRPPVSQFRVAFGCIINSLRRMKGGKKLKYKIDIASGYFQEFVANKNDWLSSQLISELHGLNFELNLYGCAGGTRSKKDGTVLHWADDLRLSYNALRTLPGAAISLYGVPFSYNGKTYVGLQNAHLKTILISRKFDSKDNGKWEPICAIVGSSNMTRRAFAYSLDDRNVEADVLIAKRNIFNISFKEFIKVAQSVSELIGNDRKISSFSNSKGTQENDWSINKETEDIQDIEVSKVKEWYYELVKGKLDPVRANSKEKFIFTLNGAGFPFKDVLEGMEADISGAFKKIAPSGTGSVMIGGKYYKEIRGLLVCTSKNPISRKNVI